MRLREKAKRLFDPHNKSTVARIFQGGEYIQDSEERQTVLSMYHLLYILACADGNLDEREEHYLKTLAFESCLTEQEWRGIEYYRNHPPSEQEIEKLADDLFQALSKKKDRREFLQQLKEMMAADEVLHGKEQAILDLIESRASGAGKVSASMRDSLMGVFRTLKADVASGLAGAPDREAAIKNPVIPILQKHAIDCPAGVAARLGFALALIHSDSNIHDSETELLATLIQTWCGLNADDATYASLHQDLMALGPDRLELAYLGQMVMDSEDEVSRIELLADLFRMAAIDGKIDPTEERDLRVIGKYLLLTHKQYIEAKLQAQPKDGL